MLGEVGWVFIYVFAFGISDLFIKHFVKNDYINLIYFVCIGIVGIFMLCCDSSGYFTFKKRNNLTITKPNTIPINKNNKLYL